MFTGRASEYVHGYLWVIRQTFAFTLIENYGKNNHKGMICRKRN